MLERSGDVSDLFFSKALAGSVDFVENAAVDPGGVFTADVNGDALLAEGGEIGWIVFLDVIIEEGGTVPGGAFLGKCVTCAIWTIDIHNDFAVFFGCDIGQI